MRNILKILFCLLICIFSGCQNIGIDVSDLNFKTESIKYSEVNGSYSFSKELFVTEGDFAFYGFEESVPESDRSSCIEAVEKLLKKVNYGSKISIYVFSTETLSDIYILDGILYTPVRDWNSLYFSTDVLSALFGKYCNYGALYGYASYLNGEKFAIFPSDIENPAILDINLLCFKSNFISEEEISIVKAISVAFINDYLSNHTIEELHFLLSASSDPESVYLFNDILFQFYKENGLDFVPGEILYAKGGYSFDYTAKCRYSEFFIEKDWLDSHNEMNPLTSENFLHDDYQSIKAFFETNSAQMQNYQELFSLANYDNSLSIVFSNSGSYSYYNSGKHTIYLLNIDSLMHEYIHSLAASSSINANWATEGFARYFSYKYDYYGIAFLNADYNSVSNSESTLYVREYRENIKRPIDMSVDFGEIENIAVYSRNYKNPNDSYAAGSSFIGYLVDIYGENAVIDSICSGGTLFIGEKNYTELVSDWNKFIEQNYSSYSKYNE